MKIVICGSMRFAKEMMELQNRLQNMGHTCVTPVGVEDYRNGNLKPKSTGSEATERKIQFDLIQNYAGEIQNADAVLVANYSRNDLPNEIGLDYIGANTLLEMGFAYVLRKKIFILFQLPTFWYHRDEVAAMKPICLWSRLEEII